MAGDPKPGNPVWDRAEDKSEEDNRDSILAVPPDKLRNIERKQMNQYPLGLFFCQFQESRHISSNPFSAFHSNISADLAGSA